MTGLPLIVSLAVLNGVLVATNLSSLSHSAEMLRVAAVADDNLRQAEAKWMSCHNSGIYTVGTDIYRSQVKRSSLTVREVPEVNGL